MAKSLPRTAVAMGYSPGKLAPNEQADMRSKNQHIPSALDVLGIGVAGLLLILTALGNSDSMFATARRHVLVDAQKIVRAERADSKT